MKETTKQEIRQRPGWIVAGICFFGMTLMAVIVVRSVSLQGTLGTAYIAVFAFKMVLVAGSVVTSIRIARILAHGKAPSRPAVWPRRPRARAPWRPTAVAPYCRSPSRTRCRPARS